MKAIFENLSSSMQKEFWAALALKQCKHLNPRLLRSLLVQYGSAYEVFCQATNKNDLVNFQPKNQRIYPQIYQELKSNAWREYASVEWQLSKKHHGEVILWTDYRYPLGLKQIVDAPPFFYARGDISLLASHSVAIVGSRKYHQNTLEKAKKIAKDLSSAGICVVSGMAKGIDYAAHLGALEEIGSTIAVLGCGINFIYPPENAEIHQEISKKGLLISEFPMDTKPHSQNFPIRNRLISGLSEAVLVAEAEMRSGSLITARLALEQNRPVYVFEPRDKSHSLGCHALMADGAIAVNDALAIIADIAPNLEDKTSVIVNKNNSKDLEQDLFQTKEIKKSIAKNDIRLKQVPRISIQSELPLTGYEIKKRPNFNENQPELEINFGEIAQGLMGEVKPFSSKEVFNSKPRSKKKKENIVKDNNSVENKEATKADNNLEHIKKVDNSQSSKVFSEIEEKILQIIQEKPLIPDEILMQLPKNLQNISNVSMTLLLLEVENYVQRLEGNRYQKKS